MPLVLASAASEFPVRLAVADGATESYGSGLWAQLLVRAYGQGCFDGGLVADELRKHQTAWHDTVSQGDLPWYAEQKMQDGAFASLLGITIDQQEDGVAEGA